MKASKVLYTVAILIVGLYMGAKNYATRNGYKTVTKRTGHNARIIAVKSQTKWEKYEV